MVRVENLVVSYRNRGDPLQAVSNLSFDILPGETLGLVGESGCGKSSVARAIVGLAPAAGSIRVDALELIGLTGDELRRSRRLVQMIFQDPIASLNPRRTARAIVKEPLVIKNAAPSRLAWLLFGLAGFASILGVLAGSWILLAASGLCVGSGVVAMLGHMGSIAASEDDEALVDAALRAVGLDPARAGMRRPHQYSGGQCQRIALARSLIEHPKVLICDEPVSALDVSVQAQIMNLLEQMKQTYDLTMLFISHDLAVVRQISDRVAVMYLGKMVELADNDALYSAPRHPYTRLLLDSIPGAPTDVFSDGTNPDCRASSLAGSARGCGYRQRCPKAQAECDDNVPAMREVSDRHWVACHFPLEPSAVI